VWNHRWEYDKGPQYLLAFARALQASHLHCTLHVVGQQFRQQPKAFDELEKLLDAGERGSTLRKGVWGFIETRDRYRALLASCDIVLSTALHDFQGISVLEAVQAGCRPLLPDQLVYPEQFAAEYLYRWHTEPQSNASAMLASLLRWYNNGLPAQPSLAQFEWHELRESYQQAINALLGQGTR
ncbi:MAG: glycosyltransferase, partial [Gammaproteobacteria bacterium]|nr:glycosyltransferase [Gammaproteobacteria bacterium]